MTDAHGVARDQLRAFIERIERLEEEKKTIADDIKEVYGEAKGTGFDTKVLRKLISIRKQDRDERMEQEAILDMYMIALGMLPETAEEAEPEAAAEATGNDLREPVAAEQGQIIREVDAPRETDRFGGDASCPDTEFQMDRATEGSFETGSEAAEKGRKATATVAAPADLNHAGAGESPATEKATVATQGEATAPTSDERETDLDEAAEGDRDGANEGGDHVDGNALRVPTSVPGEGAASALPATAKREALEAAE